MKKIKEAIIFKLIDLSLWLDEKRKGTTWDLFQYGVFWMVVVTLITWLIGKFM